MDVTTLKQRVLEELGVLAVGEPILNEDAAVVGDRYTALHDMLVTDGLVNWLVTEDIPAWAETPITMMVAAECVLLFQVPDAKRASIILEGKFDLPPAQGGPSTAEKRLRRQVSRTYVSYPQSSEYF